MRVRSTRRILPIVWMVIRFMLQIYWFYFLHSRVWDEQDKQEWKALLTKQAREYRKTAEKKGGLLVKLGQFLSSRADLLPKVFIREMEGLVDKVRPMPFVYSEAILREELGSHYESEIRDLNPHPIASASIGDVYEARLKNGKKIAVKVQRHNARQIFHMDFKALRIIFFLLRKFTSIGKKSDMKALYAEIVTIISRELDFRKELEHADYFKKRYKGNTEINMPNYYPELCTGRVLVMDWIEGRKVTDTDYLDAQKIPREQVARALFQFFADQFLNSGMFHADPHAGNIMVQPDGKIVLLDFGMVGEIRATDTDYLREAIQGVVLDDYEAVIQALYKMEFLLPSADSEKVKRIIRKTVDLYKGGQLDVGDTDSFLQLMEELQVIVKEQPIQLPADFAFLGRAVSLAIGLVAIIYPQADLVEWGKPVILRWMRGSKKHSSIYTGILTNSLRPFLSMPRALVDWLTDGEKQRSWERDKQKNQLMHQFYFFYTVLLLTLTAGSAYIGIHGIIQHTLWLILVGFILTFLFFGLSLILFIKHVLMLRSINKTRRL
ncbi:AarF/UbiB family protein [Terribacillus sp. FSL K6-0262]|uniref:ABC1 kinase family protein n=1 Tax=Terribacillus sp. FSL K6-0262 TaxID=2921447 RepID=UPI0030EC3725